MAIKPLKILPGFIATPKEDNVSKKKPERLRLLDAAIMSMLTDALVVKGETEPLSVPEMASETLSTPAEVRAALHRLELAGYIAEPDIPWGRVMLVEAGRMRLALRTTEIQQNSLWDASDFDPRLCGDTSRVGSDGVEYTGNVQKSNRAGFTDYILTIKRHEGANEWAQVFQFDYVDIGSAWHAFAQYVEDGKAEPVEAKKKGK